MKDYANLNILLVEDNQMFLNVAKQILKGHVVSVAKTVGEGLKKYKEVKPDIAFVDIGLPDGNGHELLQKIKDIDKNAYVVMLTASRLKEDVDSSLSEGAKGYVVKPFSSQRVTECIVHYKEFIEESFGSDSQG